MMPAGSIATHFVNRKVLLVGEGGVGKTSLIPASSSTSSPDDFIVTMGTKVTKKDLRIDVGARTVDLSLMIGDVLRQKGYRGSRRRASTAPAACSSSTT